MENEDESYRPKNDDEKCGSLIDFQNEDRLTLVVPDLHARPDFLLNILSADVRKIINENESDFLFCGTENTEGAESGKTVFEMVQNDLIRLVFVGDILHSENNRIRWYQIEEEFEQKQYSGEKMCIEMGEGLSLLFCLCELKSKFPKNIHILKGNHENTSHSWDIEMIEFLNDLNNKKKELILNNHSKVMYDYNLIPKEEIKE